MPSYDTVFSEAVEFTLRKEGVLSDDKDDRGGLTKYGITIPFLSDFLGRRATPDDIRALTPAKAIEVYYELLWRRQHIGGLPAEISGAVFDFAVNSGPAPALRELSELLRKNPHDMTPQELRRLRNDYVLARGRYLMNLVQANPREVKYVEGWFNRDVAMLDFAY